MIPRGACVLEANDGARPILPMSMNIVAIFSTAMAMTPFYPTHRPF